MAIKNVTPDWGPRHFDYPAVPSHNLPRGTLGSGASSVISRAVQHEQLEPGNAVWAVEGGIGIAPNPLTVDPLGVVLMPTEPGVMWGFAPIRVRVLALFESASVATSGQVWVLYLDETVKKGDPVYFTAEGYFVGATHPKAVRRFSDWKFAGDGVHGWITRG